MPGNPYADERREAERRVAEAEAARLAQETAAAKAASLNKIIADKGYQGASIDYGTRTVGGRGADREVRDDTKVMGFTVPNPDGTYSRYDADGNFSHTFKPSSGGLLGGFTDNIGSALSSVGENVSDIAESLTSPEALKGYATFAAMVAGGNALANAGVGAGAGAANPMQLDPAQMAQLGSSGANTAATVAQGVDTANKALTLKDLNTGLNILKNPGNALVGKTLTELGVSSDVAGILNNLGVTSAVTKGVNDVVKGTTGGGGTKPSGTPADGSTPYNIPPALLALLMQQQPQQAPTQTPLVDLKSASTFDPFGEFEFGSKDTADAAQGGSISDLIRMLRS